MSTDPEIRESIEKLKQAIGDARRLKKELASQLRELHETLKRNKQPRRKSKKTGP